MSRVDSSVPPSPVHLRILIVENDEEWRLLHQQMLQSYGYQPVIAEGVGKALLDDAKDKARKHRCQLAIVDVRLIDQYNPEDRSGLELVAELRPTRSIIVSVVNSRTETRDASEKYGAATFIGKEEGPGMLQRELRQQVTKIGLGSDGTEITWSHDLSTAKIRDLLFGDDSDVPDDEVDEAIMRLFVQHNRVALTLITDTDRPSDYVSAIRRQSRVFHASLDDLGASKVVKLAPVEKIDREVRNYEQYVKNRFRNIFVTMLEGDVLLWDIGAVVYSYVGNPGLGVRHGASSFKHYYQHSTSAEAILAPLRDFFDDASWGVWYTREVTALDQSLFEAYDQVFRSRLSRQLDGWRSHERLRSYPGLSGALPNPTRWLSDHYRDSGLVQARQAVAHGDLHGDNLFVYEGHAWAIDFERTGRGPILRDFAELTQDILTRCADFGAGELPLFYELAVVLCAPHAPDEQPQPTAAIRAHPEASKACEVVVALQQLAYQRTRYTDQREYLWSLLLNNLFVATLLPEEDPRRLRTLLLASVICGRLDRWDRSTWPSREWPPLGPADPPVSAARKPLASAAGDGDQKAPLGGASETGLFQEGFALLIGVGSTPAAPHLSLPVTVSDARALCEIVADVRRCAYPAEQVRLLTDRDASAAQIRAGLAWLAACARAQPNATAIVYFSGHGWWADDGRYALIPSDVRADDLAGSVIWSDELIRLLHTISARRLLVCIDACHAQGMASVKDGWAVPGDFSKAPSADLLRALKAGEGRVVLSSSRGTQSSYYRRNGLSLFTHYLIQALQGAVNHPGDRVVKISHLVNHVGEHVPRAALEEFGALQQPWVEQASEDFPIALLLGGKGLVPTAAGSPNAAESDIGALRKLLGRMLPATFEAFCQDHFFSVAASFNPGMDQETRINLLINYVMRRSEELRRLRDLLGDG